VGKLLDNLERCGPKAFDGLLKALEETKQEHVADILTDAVKQIEKSNKSGIADGTRICSYTLHP